MSTWVHLAEWGTPGYQHPGGVIIDTDRVVAWQLYANGDTPPRVIAFTQHGPLAVSPGQLDLAAAVAEAHSLTRYLGGVLVWDPNGVLPDITRPLGMPDTATELLDRWENG